MYNTTQPVIWYNTKRDYHQYRPKQNVILNRMYNYANRSEMFKQYVSSQHNT